MRTETEKFKIGTLTDPNTKEKIEVNKKYPYSFRIFIPEGAKTEADYEQAVKDAMAVAEDKWSWKNVAEVIDRTEKSNASQNEYQKVAKTFYKDVDDLTPEQKEKIADENAIKALMNATKCSREQAEVMVANAKQ